MSTPGLAWQACLKKTEVELKLLTDNDMLMVVEKGVRPGKYQTVCKYAKANNKYMKNCDKDIESSYLEYLDSNNLYGLAISQKLPADGIDGIKGDDISKFNESLIKHYNVNSDKGYFLEVDVEYLRNLHELHRYLPFFSERNKIKNVKSLSKV